MEPDISQFTAAYSTQPLESIGQGFCGSVWSTPVTPRDRMALVIKREDGGPGRSLAKEYYMYRHVISCLSEFKKQYSAANGPQINIPHCEGFLLNTSSTWSQLLPGFPVGYATRNALISEKIPPLPRNVRLLLAEGPLQLGKDAAAAADGSTNAHCLVRPYLGRRQYPDPSSASRLRHVKSYSLRNLPLHFNQMEDLGLDCEAYALAMADALAFLHWWAKVDADDVEFVLASPRERHGATDMQDQRPSIGSRDFKSEAFGSHGMWILDFDCCKRITMDENGIKQACRSFLKNEPYYPRPGSNDPRDQTLWNAFQERFLQTSNTILEKAEQDVRQLPRRLIHLITETRGKISSGKES